MKIVFALVSLLLLSGCAHQHGIARVAFAERFPSADEIEQALRATPEVREVGRSATDGTTPVDRVLGINKGWREGFMVRGASNEMAFFLSFDTSKKGKSILMQAWTYESNPASFRIADMRSFMAIVYRSLLAQFPFLPAEDRFTESSTGLELESDKRPNQSVQPTPTAVTPRAKE